jgi:hypothetical protein
VDWGRVVDSGNEDAGNRNRVSSINASGSSRRERRHREADRDRHVSRQRRKRRSQGRNMEEDRDDVPLAVEKEPLDESVHLKN